MNQLIKGIGIISILIVIIILLSLGLVYLKGEFDFNPDEDVCEEIDESMMKGCTTTGHLTETAQEYCRDVNGVFIKDEKYGWCCEICKSWRPKTKCELNPNDEGCVCDEHHKKGFRTIVSESFQSEEELMNEDWRFGGGCYDITYVYNLKENNETYEISKRDISTFKSYYSEEQPELIEIKCYFWDDVLVETDYCLEAHLKPTPIKINLEEEKCVEHSEEINDCSTKVKYCKSIGRKKAPANCDFADSYCCLKKEKLNECEKGDKDWILEEGFYCNDKLLTTKKLKDNETIEIQANCKVIHKDDVGIVFEWKKTCRKKTIKDLDCEKLKDYYLNGNRCPPFNCKYPSAEDKEIAIEFIERCGGTK